MFRLAAGSYMLFAIRVGPSAFSKRLQIVQQIHPAKLWRGPGLPRSLQHSSSKLPGACSVRTLGPRKSGPSLSFRFSRAPGFPSASKLLMYSEHGRLSAGQHQPRNTVAGHTRGIRHCDSRRAELSESGVCFPSFA